MVSVIITTYNSSRYIDHCIHSIRNSEGIGPIEIIVVDNNSTDDTADIARKALAVVYNKGPERSAQRNYGVANSYGKYVMILDVDMTIHPRLIKECIAKCETYDGLYIPEIVVDQDLDLDCWDRVYKREKYWVKVRRYERSFYNGTRVDAIRFMKRSHWIEYDVELTGAEDWDHDRRFAGKKGITELPLWHNEELFNIKTYAKKKAYYSQWLDIYKKRYGNVPELNPVYRYFGVFVEDGKWKKIIRHPIFFLAMMYLRVIVGIAYLRTKKL